MRTQKPLHEIEKELNSFPNFKLAEEKQYEIHEILMAEVTKWEMKKRRGSWMRRLTVGLSSVAVVILALFLGFSYFDSHGGNRPTENPEVQPNPQAPIYPTDFIVEADFHKLVARTDQVTGEETHYTTKDKEIIHQFEKTIVSMPYEKTEKTSSVFNTNFLLYDTSNELIAEIIFTGENIVSINGEGYKTDEAKLNQFKEIFFTEDYQAYPVINVPESSVQELAQEIIQALANKDTAILAQHVHPVKGLLFSPYVYIQDDALVFTQDEVTMLLAASDTYLWGTFDGSGEPMEMTAKEYYSRFVYDHDYVQAHEMNIDSILQRGNSINNIKEKFPDSTVVEFHIKGTEQYGGMDWRSLNLVFEQAEDGALKLVAIIHDEWTI
ncbi:hypothetical protein SAMN05877753_102604 [Bacillus oleivorans]|uniref:Uncharacterized protein n=1 Tax=Bacillus oleivorans TaxID=1448271 RepID=A0A285CM01_9BACI|nr:hypothetical protein [Bacillus oleivorans]SNX68579.1 hypothetical protein SAMN05877753_102604 [Bacillus oleivorans]